MNNFWIQTSSIFNGVMCEKIMKRQHSNLNISKAVNLSFLQTLKQTETVDCIYDLIENIQEVCCCINKYFGKQVWVFNINELIISPAEKQFVYRWFSRYSLVLYASLYKCIISLICSNLNFDLDIMIFILLLIAV